MFFKSKRGQKGIAFLAAILAINIMAIFSLMTRSLWETEMQRELEEELLFRAGQYKIAIELYAKENVNLYPREFNVLFEKKFLRQMFKDPMSETGKWNYVMRGGTSGSSELLIVPEEFLPQYIDTARIVGVASSSPDEGFKEYRGKKRYSEWAVYVGEKVDKEMPELKFVNEDTGEEEKEGQKDSGLGGGGLNRDNQGQGEREREREREGEGGSEGRESEEREPGEQ